MSPRPFDAVLLDLDGVLIDSKEVWFALIAGLRRELGYPELDRAAFEQTWGQGLAADVEALFPRHDIETLAALYRTRFSDHLDHLILTPGGPELIARCRAAGLRTAVVTNTPRPLADDLLARAGVGADVVIGGTDAPRAKPWPDPILLACERLGVAPERALMVGDTRYDAEAALAAGAAFCGFGGLPGRYRATALARIAAIALGEGEEAPPCRAETNSATG